MIVVVTPRRLPAQEGAFYTVSSRLIGRWPRVRLYDEVVGTNGNGKSTLMN
jgi:hypothetical protein